MRLRSSIGRAMADVEVRIVDEENRPVSHGTVGEIVARGARVMSGYWKDKEKTAKAIDKESWLHTGDMGYMDDEGYIYLAGRGDDMIIRAGENISPEEVEQAIQSHPKVEEAGVIGVPDPAWGQEVKVVVALKKGQKATAEEIIEYSKKKLSSFKAPKAVAFVDVLPRNPMGKLIRKELREKYGKTL
ncbi:MAG: long-chain-fatty-acid--CoA ligase [Dehalococcoidia bacterium]|nr:long-chain-fatty-acid--CoA ligase [Dehalococcoidia bacterium]